MDATHYLMLAVGGVGGWLGKMAHAWVTRKWRLQDQLRMKERDMYADLWEKSVRLGTASSALMIAECVEADAWAEFHAANVDYLEAVGRYMVFLPRATAIAAEGFWQAASDFGHAVNESSDGGPPADLALMREQARGAHQQMAETAALLQAAIKKRMKT